VSGPVVYSVGYEGATLAEVVSRLKAAGVTRVLDVRAVASSRRAGFSKTILWHSLAAEGIAYVHLRALGTPKPGRDAARKGRTAEMRAIFEGQLATPEAQDALAQAAALVAERPTALLCFCGQAEKCHRRALTERLSTALGAAVVDL
jgi:uncharacterized protein (DUF488 family)